MALSTTSDNVGHFTAGAEGSYTHEVVRAGLLGATTVWIWIFLIGALSGSPLRLASLFGRGVTHIVGVQSTAPEWIAVIVFTVLHFIIWYGLAEVGVVVLRAAARSPAVLMLAIFIGILLLLALVGITMIFASDGLGAAFAWPSIYVGSILGLTVMWWYLIRHHPEVRTQMAHVDDDS